MCSLRFVKKATFARSTFVDCFPLLSEAEWGASC